VKHPSVDCSSAATGGELKMANKLLICVNILQGGLAEIGTCKRKGDG